LIGPGGGTPANDGADEMIRLREGTGGDFRNILIAYGNGVGLRVKDAATQALIGDSLLWSNNNIIYDCSGGQFHSDVASVLGAQNIDPQFRALEGRESGNGLIDPRPVFGSNAYTGGEQVPDDGFFTQADFIGAFGDDLWLKGWSLLSELGRLTEVSAIDNELLTVARSFTMDVYPNPFNPNTSIKINLPKNDIVTVSVYNMLGEKVAELFSGYLNKGNHTIQFDGTKFSSGIYILNVSTGEMTYAHRITLLK
jgi:hypothetical protein